MRRYIDQKFSGWYDRDSGRVFEDAEFVRCQFDNCGISIAEDPKLRSTVRNMRFTDCLVAALGINSPIVENVEVEDLQLGASKIFLLEFRGAAFKHVKIKGKTGRLLFRGDIGGSFTSKQQLAFEEANTQYYRMVDWALDITQLECAYCEIRSIPSRLVLRDPETQAVVTRKAALEERWKGLDLSDTPWPAALFLMLHREDEDVVLVAPKRHRDFKKHLEGIRRLRDAGIAEPD